MTRMERMRGFIGFIRERAASGEPFTSEDVMASVMCGAKPNRSDINALGSLLSLMTRFMVIKPCGVRKGKARGRSHAGKLTVYVGVGSGTNRRRQAADA